MCGWYNVISNYVGMSSAFFSMVIPSYDLWVFMGEKKKITMAKGADSWCQGLMVD